MGSGTNSSLSAVGAKHLQKTVWGIAGPNLQMLRPYRLSTLDYYPWRQDMADTGKEYVLKECKERGVEFIRLWFTDLLGIMKSFAITVESLEEALDEGMGFDGSSITGYQDIQESAMIAMTDPSPFTLLP